MDVDSHYTDTKFTTLNMQFLFENFFKTFRNFDSVRRQFLVTLDYTLTACDSAHNSNDFSRHFNSLKIIKIKFFKFIEFLILQTLYKYNYTMTA